MRSLARRCEVTLQLNLRQPRQPSCAERHRLAIGLGLTLVGFAAVGSIQLTGAKGSLATLLGAFAAFALLFSQGFLWRSGPMFPPSEVTRKNRWKYLILAVLLWGGLFLVWWYRVRPL